MLLKMQKRKRYKANVGYFRGRRKIIRKKRKIKR